MGARELAPGVFAVMAHDAGASDQTATNAGFVVGEGGVLVVESLATGALASQLIGEICKVTPLPIRFLVNTSYHGDHCFGNFVFPAGTTVIQHAATKAFLDGHFEDDRAFMLGLLGEGRGVEEVVPRPADLVVSDRLVLDLGGAKTAEVFHPGFAQTPGDLVVMLSEENVLYVGNLLPAPAPAFPWLLDGRHREAIETYKRLHDALDDGTTIVTGHGGTAKRDDLLYPVAYLEELDRRVGEALGRGLSLEETAQEVRMEGYSGYSMYEAIHFGVNVAAVYRELASR